MRQSGHGVCPQLTPGEVNSHSSTGYGHVLIEYTVPLQNAETSGPAGGK